MNLVVLLQLERLLPAIEVEAVLARLAHQLAQLAGRQRAHRAFRVHADAMQHFVLDDVADAGEHVLVEQRVGCNHPGRGAQLATRGGGVPCVGHDVGAPLVVGVEVALEEAHRTGIEVQCFALAEAERQPRRTLAFFIDAPAAEQQEVDAQAEAVELQQEVLSPAAYGQDLAPLHARDVLRAVARDPQDPATGELRRGLAEDDDGGAFGHVRSIGVADEACVNASGVMVRERPCGDCSSSSRRG